MSQSVSNQLRTSPELVQELPNRVAAEAFLNKLAEFGIVPETPDQVEKLWAIGLACEGRDRASQQSKTAGMIDWAYQAAFGQAQAAQPAASGDQLIAHAAMQKAAQYLADPVVFAHGLASALNQGKEGN